MSLLYTDKLLRQSGLTHKSGILTFTTGIGYCLDEMNGSTKLIMGEFHRPICSELIGKQVNVSGLICESGRTLQVQNIYSIFD